MKKQLLIILLVVTLLPMMAWAEIDEEEISFDEIDEAADIVEQLLSRLHLKLYMDAIYRYGSNYDQNGFSSDHQILLGHLDMGSGLSAEFDLLFHYNAHLLWMPEAWMELRVGKFRIPFGESADHPLYGGYVSEGSVGVFPFYPADYGLWARFRPNLILSPRFDLYVTNGFGQVDTLGSGGIESWPNFTDLGRRGDTNEYKAVGARVGMTPYRRMTLSGSVLKDRWSDTGGSHLLMWSADAVCATGFLAVPALDRLGLKASIMAGYVQSLRDEDNVKNCGFAYSHRTEGSMFEANLAMGNRWLIRGRWGSIDPDSRVRDANDLRRRGLQLEWRAHPGLEIHVRGQRTQVRGSEQEDSSLLVKLLITT